MSASTTQEEIAEFVKHVGAPSFKEAVDVLLRTKQQDEDKIAKMFADIKRLGAENRELQAKLTRAFKTIDELNEAAIGSSDFP